MLFIYVYLYKNQPRGEWLRIAVPLDSMIDSDGIPHLKKLGSALGNLLLKLIGHILTLFFILNSFLVQKNDTSSNKNK